MAIENLIESIQAVFRGRDTKEKELHNQKESLTISIEAISKNIDSLSYKALIEEDEAAIKEHEALKVELDTKVKELKAIDEKIKALGKFEVSKDLRAKAAEAYKETQREMDKKSKELGKITTDFYKTKTELEKIVQHYVKVNREIELLPLQIQPMLDYINPEDIGKTEEDIKEYHNRANRDNYTYNLFENNRFKYQDKNVTREDIHRLYQGSISVNPYGQK